MPDAKAIPRKHRVKHITYPSSRERSVLLELPSGLAHEPSALYVVARMRVEGHSPNTMYQSMLAVSLLLDWALHKNIDLDQRIGQLDLFSRGEVLSLKDALRADLRPKHVGQVVSPAHFVSRCLAVKDYVVWHAQNVVYRMSARDARRSQAAQVTEDFAAMMMAGLPNARSGEREGLDEEVQSIFREAIKPENPLNPFQRQHQARNHALLLLYWEKGPRRGENLKIKVEDLLLAGYEPKILVRARPDDPQDTRKHAPRVKTEERDLDISHECAAAIERWLAERAKYPNAKRCPFLFISRDGNPLAADTVNDMFRLLRNRVPGLPPDLVPHQLRHSANDRFTDMAAKHGLDEAAERQLRNYMFGWKKGSNQGEHYSKRSTRKRAQEASLRMQKLLTETPDE